ncbi:hypothetical protein [Streptomyces sp. NPDC001480]|uniref:hypothetical protein n=1 Tax=Streptomyces sp. NPDC001480 TaxID=3364577 RepID=UPI0036C33B4C
MDPRRTASALGVGWLLLVRGLVRLRRLGPGRRRYEQQLQAILVEGLGEVYFRDGGRRARGCGRRTRRSYAQDWVSWTRFCAASGVPVLALTLGTLVMFVEWLWTQSGGRKGTCTAPSTIDRRISGTAVSARSEHGVRLEDGVARLGRNRLKQLVKEMEEQGETRGRGQAPPLLVEHLVKISTACPDNLTGLRDRALVLMHFAVAGRRHDLAFNRVRDYAETPGSIQADLRVSKISLRVVPVPYGSRPSFPTSRSSPATSKSSISGRATPCSACCRAVGQVTCVPGAVRLTNAFRFTLRRESTQSTGSEAATLWAKDERGFDAAAE